jgi:hypothetical protein
MIRSRNFTSVWKSHNRNRKTSALPPSASRLFDSREKGGTYQDRTWQDRAWRDSHSRWDDRRGFWPGDVAAGVGGGAVGTVAAIATSPIGGDEYARRNGFVCTPGTWFRGEDGRRHLCQQDGCESRSEKAAGEAAFSMRER